MRDWKSRQSLSAVTSLIHLFEGLSMLPLPLGVRVKLLQGSVLPALQTERGGLLLSASVVLTEIDFT